jgi:polar amino acid transport system substrate-binding protein
MDLLTMIGIAAVVASILLLLWMKYHYSKEIGRLNGEIKLFKNANEYQDEAVVVFSSDYEVLSANRAARKLLQLEPFHQNMVPEKDIFLQVGHSDPQSLFEVIEKQGKITKGTVHLEKVMMTVDGTKRPVNIYIDHSKWNLKNSIICVFHDASCEHAREENLKRMGEVDFLTNLSSQFKANSDINNMVIAAQRESKQLAFYIFGINHFDKMKVTYGLAYTNNLLKKLAEFLRGMEREDAFSYRLDCDNFLYIVKNIESEEAALEKGKKISKMIARFFKQSSRDTNPAFSIGIVMYPDHGRNAAKLIDHAYIALAEARERSDGSIEIFKKKQSHIQSDQKIMTEEIKKGLKNREFEIYYQPIISLKTLQVEAAEALIRWNHPRLGLIGPDKFIHLAEVSGLIMDIGEYVLEEVIRQHKHWIEFNFKSIEITINISARELLTYQLGERLEQLFIDEKVDPHYFNLDISESDAMEDTIKTDLEFSILKKIGVNLSIDHFGVSGSPIEQLQKLPIHTLKIDRSLLKNVDADKNNQEAVKAIVVLAHALNLKTVAEGIETKEQYAMLQKLGCDQAQGYIFSKPAPAFEFQELIRPDARQR